MKRALTRTAAVVVLVLAAPLSPVSADPIHLNFDSFPGFATPPTAMPFVPALAPVPSGAQLSNQFLAQYGLSISSSGGFASLVNLGPFTTSEPQGLGGSTAAGLLSYSGSDPITFTFFDPSNTSQKGVTDFVSVRTDTWPTSGEVVRLLAFDVNGNLIGTAEVLDQIGSAGGFFLSINAPGIHRVVYQGFVSPDGLNDGVAIDDLRFNPVQGLGDPTPEPTSLVVFGTVVLGGCVYARWRARRRQQAAAV